MHPSDSGGLRSQSSLRTSWRAIASTVLLLAAPHGASAFSVMAHQGIVDACWQDSFVPAIRRRFPDVEGAGIERARGFAYGGSHIADLGYFPFGNRLFSDLAHYVRTGDFVRAMIDDARTPEELAFALGALSHFVGDSIGHPEATNRAVATIYPGLRAKYGDWVTFTDDPGAHRATEFRFDVLQLAGNRQAPPAFRTAVGFEVSEALLDRAFRKIYGLGLDDVFMSTDAAITTYRWGFREALQGATDVAWRLYPGEIHEVDPSASRDSFVFTMSRGEFERRFGRNFREAGVLAKTLAIFTNLVPAVAPLQRLPFEPLPPDVQREFGDAFAHAVMFVRADLEEGRPRLPNLNLDTGAPARGGEYDLADATYAELLDKLDAHGFAGVTPSLRTDLVRYFEERDTDHPFDPDDAGSRARREEIARLVTAAAGG